MTKRQFRSAKSWGGKTIAITIPQDFVEALQIRVGTNLKIDLVDAKHLVIENADTDLSQSTQEAKR